MRHVIAIGLCLALLGCSEYEQDQFKAAGENIKQAADHVGNASGSAADRARTSTAQGLRDTADAIEPEDPEESDASDDAGDDQ